MPTINFTNDPLITFSRTLRSAFNSPRTLPRFNDVSFNERPVLFVSYCSLDAYTQIITPGPHEWGNDTERQRRRDNAETEGAWWGNGRRGGGGKWALRGTQVERLGYSGSAVFRESIWTAVNSYILARTNSIDKICRVIHVFVAIDLSRNRLHEREWPCSSGYNEWVADHSCRSVGLLPFWISIVRFVSCHRSLDCETGRSHTRVICRSFQLPACLRCVETWQLLVIPLTID